MPYVHKDVRDRIGNIAGDDELYSYLLEAPGNLNYLITLLLAQYTLTNGLSYHTINDIMGVMTSAQAEFYRRVAVPYENQKIIDNGDVYPTELTQGGQR